jgi:hypothetical protein
MIGKRSLEAMRSVMALLDMQYAVALMLVETSLQGLDDAGGVGVRGKLWNPRKSSGSECTSFEPRQVEDDRRDPKRENFVGPTRT